MLRYHARMAEQDNARFGDALREALRTARMSQAELARQLGTDPGQVSRWVNNKSLPHVETVGAIEDRLSADLSAAFSSSTPTHELYVSAPITGLAVVPWDVVDIR